MMLRDRLGKKYKNLRLGLDIRSYAIGNVVKAQKLDVLHRYEDMSLFPPMPRFWMEYDLSDIPGHSLGFYVEAEDHGPGPQAARWTLWVKAFVDDIPAVHDWRVEVGADGKPVRQGLLTMLSSARPSSGMMPLATPIATKEQIDSILQMPVLLALSFMNTRGMVQRECKPPKRRDAKHRGLPPTISYWVLDIGPSVRSEWGNHPDSGADPRALHQVRGHTAFYADKDGHRLYGKYTGLIYRRGHISGSRSAGVVVKDYNLKPAA